MTVTMTSGTRSPSCSSVRSSAARSMLPLNGCERRGHAALGDDEVARLGPLDLDVGARRVEVVVVRDDLARLEHGVEEDALGGAALVGRDDVAEAGQVAGRRRGSGRRSGCRRRTRRPASARPTARPTWRRCRSRSGGRSGRPRRAGGRRCSRPRARACSRSSRRVNLIASTDLMRNGSMIVRKCASCAEYSRAHGRRRGRALGEAARHARRRRDRDQRTRASRGSWRRGGPGTSATATASVARPARPAAARGRAHGGRLGRRAPARWCRTASARRCSTERTARPARRGSRSA